MSKFFNQISAYIDNELDAGERSAFEAELETNSELAAEFRALQNANDYMMEQFDLMEADAVSPDLISQIARTELDVLSPVAANQNIGRRSIAAGLAMLVLGGLGGYVLHDRLNVRDSSPINPDWLDQVASYHSIYAEQKRHLVEVGAEESAHIVKWLSNTTEVSFSIPDITASGYLFEGARLLAVNGAPVAQLMYKNEADDVLAICFKKSSLTGMQPIQENNINSFNIMSWRDRSANFLVIGDTPPDQLRQIADQVKLSI